MAQHPEHVIVVGAGMVGLSTAWFLQQQGVRVTVLDRNGVAAGSSWGNAGWLAPALTLPLPEPAILASGVRAALSPSSPVFVPFSVDPKLWRFLIGFARNCTPARWRKAMQVFNLANAQALEAFDELSTAGGPATVAEPTKEASPFLAGFSSEMDQQALIAEFEQSAGRTRYDVLDGATMRSLEPLLGSGVTHGIQIHDQRFINPGDFVHSLAASVAESGGEIIADATVLDVVERADAVEIRCDNDSRLTADRVVIANGSWFDRLARPHGVKKIVQAGRGYSFTVHPDHVPTGPVYFPAQRVACTPLGGPEDGLRVAGMMEFRSPDAAFDPRRIAAIIDAAADMLTGVDWSKRSDEWVGSRPCTADGLPLIGRTRSSRVFVCGGHGMWGMALGPLSGKILAEQMVHRRDSPLLRAFDPLR